MKTFSTQAARKNTFAREAPDYIDNRVLGVATEETHNVPTGAKICVFSANADFYARADATAAIPSGDVTDGTGSELNPTQWGVANISTIHLIAPAATKISLTFYA